MLIKLSYRTEIKTRLLALLPVLLYVRNIPRFGLSLGPISRQTQTNMEEADCESGKLPGFQQDKQSIRQFTHFSIKDYIHYYHFNLEFNTSVPDRLDSRVGNLGGC